MRSQFIKLCHCDFRFVGFCVALMENRFSVCQFWPFCYQYNLQMVYQIRMIRSCYCITLFEVIRWDYSLGILKDSGQHLLSWRNDFDILWCTFTSICPLLWLLLGPRCTMMNLGFVHDHKSMQKIFGITIKHLQTQFWNVLWNEFLVGSHHARTHRAQS